MCRHAGPARLALSADTGAPGAARRFVRQRLCPVHGADVLDAAELLVTELVTNALLHGAPPLAMALDCGNAGLRIRVTDASSDLPAPRDAAEDDQGGRGLLLVQAVSAAWGIEAAGRGKSVWFTLDALP